jgi:hypothetical protein
VPAKDSRNFCWCHCCNSQRHKFRCQEHVSTPSIDNWIWLVTGLCRLIEALVYSVDVAIEKPRTAHRMTQWTTVGEIDDSAMQYIKVNVFFPFIDHCLMQSDQRFPADKTDMFLASKLPLLRHLFSDPLCMYYCYNSCNLFNKYCLH